MMTHWDTGWAIEFPARDFDELLLALVVRDLIHGASYDVEAEETGEEFAVDYTAGDEFEDDCYRLLLIAEIDGPERSDLLQAFTEHTLEELLDEAEELVKQRADLAELAVDDIRFEAVPEDEERWDLVIPDWLAPDGAEVPFGFRAYDVGSGEPVPDNATLDAHGRVLLIPFGDRFRLTGIPAPSEHDHPGGPVD
jgi:hypothetical protein